MKEKNVTQAKKTKNPIAPYLLILPPIVFMGMFSFYPFIKTIVSTFSITSPYGEFISFYGLGNWARLFEGGELLKSILTTLQFAGLSLTVSFVVAMLFAIFCSDKGRGSRIYQTLFGLPMVIATAPVAAIWVFIYRQHAGLLNQFLGTNISWLKNPETALVAVAVVTAWSHVASNYLYLLVGFRNVSDDLIEAAKIDGAGWWIRTFKIMIPMASPQIFFVFFLNIVWSLKTITQIKLLTGGGPSRATTTLMYSIYDKAILRGQFEYACYNEEGDNGWSNYCVNGYATVKISKDATLDLDYWKGDNSVVSISRGSAVSESEKGVFLFCDYENNGYVDQIGPDYLAVYDGVVEQSYNYLVKAEANGTVSADGNYLIIKPNEGLAAKVIIDKNVVHYAENETAYKLPALDSSIEKKEILIEFDVPDTSIDTTKHEAKIGASYYETLEEAVNAAEVLSTENKNVVVATLNLDNVVVQKIGTTKDHHGVYIQSGTVNVTSNNSATEGLSLDAVNGFGIVITGGQLTASIVKINDVRYSRNGISVTNATAEIEQATITNVGVKDVRVKNGSIKIGTVTLADTANTAWIEQEISYFYGN